MIKNLTNRPFEIEGEEPLDPRHVRLYHTGAGMNDWKDVPLEEYERMVEEYRNDPFCQILEEEIQKEINKEVIALIKGQQ